MYRCRQFEAAAFKEFRDAKPRGAIAYSHNCLVYMFAPEVLDLLLATENDRTKKWFSPTIGCHFVNESDDFVTSDAANDVRHHPCVTSCPPH
jgi:hypothetical protein